MKSSEEEQTGKQLGEYFRGMMARTLAKKKQGSLPTDVTVTMVLEHMIEEIKEYNGSSYNDDEMEILAYAFGLEEEEVRPRVTTPPPLPKNDKDKIITPVKSDSFRRLPKRLLGRRPEVVCEGGPQVAHASVPFMGGFFFQK